MATAQQVTEGQLGLFHAAVATAFAEGLNLNVAVPSVGETLDWRGALAGTGFLCSKTCQKKRDG